MTDVPTDPVAPVISIFLFLNFFYALSFLIVEIKLYLNLKFNFFIKSSTENFKLGS